LFELSNENGMDKIAPSQARMTAWLGRKKYDLSCDPLEQPVSQES